MDIFRIFDPTGPKRDPVEKRRHQLRQAQRTYRDKGVRYTKTLEDELARTRANEAKLMRECARMQSTIQKLLEVLASYGDEVPEGLLDEADFGLHNDDTANGRSASESKQRDERALEHLTDFHKLGRHHKNPVHSLEIEAGLPIGERHDIRLGDLDPANVGMEFVLSLEEPCLGHLHRDPNKPHDPTGHALTTSAQLHCISMLQPAQINSNKLQFDNVPAHILEHLLHLSTSMCTDNELTPAQAWHSIRQQPHFGGLELKDLHELAGRLRETIKCHGFGAVIQISAFKKLMFETLIVGRVF